MIVQVFIMSQSQRDSLKELLAKAQGQAVKSYEEELNRVEEQVKNIDFGKCRKASKEG